MLPLLNLKIMARPKNKEKTVSESATPKPKTVVEAAAPKENKATPIPEKVDAMMRLYPQYKEIYVTPKGFVHTKDAPKYAIKDAVLYQNKYYKP